VGELLYLHSPVFLKSPTPLEENLGHSLPIKWKAEDTAGASYFRPLA
jgi:hypothetical protein